MLPYRALTKNAGGVIPLAERCEVKVRDVRRWLAADGWVLVGTGGYWWVLVGTGGYWWVLVGTGAYARQPSAVQASGEARCGHRCGLWQ
jgi:hypothetical protein